MKKTPRTYRLSGEALLAIENRDTALYPSANSFVEHVILKERREGELLAILADIHQEVTEVRQMLLEERQSTPPIPQF